MARGRARDVYTSSAILIPFNSQRLLLWRFSVAENNKTNLGIKTECLILLSDISDISA